MELKINIKKEYLIILVALAVIATALAYGTNNPGEFGHSSGEVEVTIGSDTMTLQEAITSGRLSGSSSSLIKVDYSQCVKFGARDGGSSRVNDTWRTQCPTDTVMIALWDDDNGFDDVDEVKCCKLKSG